MHHRRRHGTARHGMRAERGEYGVHAGMHALSDSTISIDKYNV
jgi:hypothetical protein